MIHAHVVERLDSTNKQNAPTRAHIYTHTRVYINVYAYIYTDIHTYIYTHIHMHIYTHICTHIYICMHMHTYTQIKKSQYRRLNVSSNLIDAYTYPYTYACIYTYICIYTYVHNLYRVCSQMCTLMSKKHMCNVHTCPCTGAQNTCSKVLATLTAKKCTYICTHTQIHTHTYAHEHTRAFMIPPKTQRH